ncbi:MAG: NAD-dependent epimerase/dehydratase family protein [Acetobacteraceae bacterium]
MNDPAPPRRPNVLVLGAAGFIGSNVVQALSRSPAWRPVAAPRRMPATPFGSDVEVRRCDATSPPQLGQALHDIDFVVNCVGGTNQALMDATRALCDVARRQPPKRIVHLSTMAVYGEASGTVKEDMSAVPPLRPYGEAHHRCEEMIRAYVRDGGDAVILRPGCIYGPGSRQWTIRLARLLRDGRIGDLGRAGDGICNLVFIDDMVQVIISALDTPGITGQAFNIADGGELTWNQFLTKFGQMIGATPIRRLSPRRIAVESKLVAPALRIFDMAARKMRISPDRLPEPINPSLAALLRQDIRLDSSKAMAELRLHRTPVDEGLRQSALWLESRIPGRARRHAGQNRAMELGQR